MQVIQRPVTGEDFFDREDILERLKAERNFALIGQRKVGKTSIILEYLSRNPDPQVLTPYIYTLFEETPPSFFRKYLRATLLTVLSAELKAGLSTMSAQAGPETISEEVDPFAPIEELTADTIQILLLRTRYLAKQQRYYIPDPTLQFWLEYCYPLQEEVYLADPSTSSGQRFDVKIERFRSQAEAMIAAYKREVGSCDKVTR